MREGNWLSASRHEAYTLSTEPAESEKLKTICTGVYADHHEEMNNRSRSIIEYAGSMLMVSLVKCTSDSV